MIKSAAMQIEIFVTRWQLETCALNFLHDLKTVIPNLSGEWVIEAMNWQPTYHREVPWKLYLELKAVNLTNTYPDAN